MNQATFPTATAVRHMTRAERTNRQMFPPLGKIILENITDDRKLKGVWMTFLGLAGQTDEHGSGLSYEGFRKSLDNGYFDVDDLPRLFEAMAVNGIDPLQSLAAIEAACIPRDPDLNGQLADELLEVSTAGGEIAQNIKANGNTLDGYSNTKLRGVMAIAAQTIAAGRKLYQECLNEYEA